VNASAEFLTELYGAAETGWLTLFTVNPVTGSPNVEWAPATEPVALAAAAAKHSATCDVWFGVATRRQRLARGQRGGDKDCFEVPGLWVDIDIAGPNHKTANALPPSEEAALELIWSFNLPATAIVHTGGGLHAYWLFGEMRAVADLGDVLPRWGATWRRLADVKGWYLDNVWDPARILRLPGTWNRKNEPTPVRVLERWLR
jgi:putative DNA primase/helicase